LYKYLFVHKQYFIIKYRSKRFERQIIHATDPPSGMYRRQTTQGVATLVKSVARLGGYDPTQLILIRKRLDRDLHNLPWHCVDGNHRVEYAVQINMPTIPCFQLKNEVVSTLHICFCISNTVFQDGIEMPTGVEMLLSWGSNYQHDKVCF
jgi:hypothetical protein